jgi:hypothetical protein
MVLCSAMFLFAKDQNKTHVMTGWLCNERCVDQSSAQATCTQSCSETSGNVVFIHEDGNISNISNQDMVKLKAGKKVKMKGTMDPSTGMMTVEQIMIEYPPAP